MKKLLKNIAVVIASVSVLTACTKLDVDVTSELTSENFPKTDAEFIAASGPAYTQLRSQYTLAYWFMQDLSSDEAVMPARAGNWYDAGRYEQFHKHTWKPDHAFVQSTWQWGFGTINTCNNILALFGKLPEGPSKRVSVSEIKATRALAYYHMMDLYGNIPVIKTFGDTSALGTVPRTEVFKFIESELKEVLPGLSAVTGMPTYGRPTKWMAFALLAKLYINAEYYTGKPMYTEAAAMCDSVIQSKKFSLTADYNSMFAPTNGPDIKEFIFAIPYDGVRATGQFLARYSLHPILKDKYGIPYTPSNALSTIPSFYALYNDATDERNKMWLAGKQYLDNGSPIIVKTTKVGLDQTYKGSDASTSVNYHLEFTPELTLTDVAKFDVGNDELGKAKGIRNNKFSPDKTSPDRNQGNDFPVFRYADILLMKAECILRGAAVTFSETPLMLVNRVRSRAKASTLPAIDLTIMLEERGRELAFETWRRNDLIRFGKFEDAWGFKVNNDVNMRIYPIPTTERQLNPKLKQNAGYN